MYAEERHQAIAELVATRGRVAVTELASHFDVTTETVRRDLSQLEKLKLLRRVHGGAVSTRSVTMLEAQLPDRDLAQAGEKERIARAAAALLPEGGCTLLLDAGSTTVRLAALLPPTDHWTVITHAVPIAALLAPLPHVELHLLPGRVRPATQAAVGHATIEAIGQLRADLAFVGTNGISVRHGLSTPDPEEAATKRALIASGQRVVVLADATKVGQERTVRFADLEDVDVLVTDDGIDGEDAASFEAIGLDVVRA
ncbi:DeoR/GlpR family DNA-binding transcription regulator [Nocardioides halotolerans]|jgi:DeoR family fructose operon transcriptional repressor|uniref:DeoR/GlpR family DNA-binding transcription regulator n=1 Tax=Nocardioides halotolerans TaxID=433660 RepID=UPI000400A0FE|nr:DeoR/GlpR family DNA-binding transcription regulator [Nocardioides halotolerans]